ncbi:MAG TPA: arginine--tRNA ligase [Gammaproteobacteria bacterium]|nr:arginine--tRNA ligase [Gammaproteobacteria bacterium]
MTFSTLLKQRCQQALALAFSTKIAEIDLALLDVTEATQQKFGHYQFNSAMKLSKILGENPRQIAEKMVQALNTLPDTAAVFSKIEIAGPGFINFSFNPNFISSTLQAQCKDPHLGVSPPHKSLKVILDFSSPNIAKEMHVGHLRSTIIGDCLAKILAFMGHSVFCLNHVGDWGTQFGMLIAYLKKMLPTITDPIPPNVDLGSLATWYQASKKQFDEDPAFKKQAQQEVVALQSGFDPSKRAWEHICAISRTAYQHIYDLLDIHLVERGESFYNPLLAPVLQQLEKEGLLTYSEGAKCIYLDGFTNREGEPLPLILQKSDGGYNYATTDMAALQHRIQKEQGDWLIYITDAGQALHFQMVFAAGKKAGFFDSKKVQIDHVPFGLVLKSDGKKFQTRSGQTERLIDLLHTAIEHAKQKLKAHNPDISGSELEASANVLGINAIKYADLSCHRLSDYVFSYDKMLQFEGNTAAFLLYAYVRIQSIQRKVNIDIEGLLANDTPIVLDEPAEIALGLLVCQFNEVLENCARELLPNRLTDYLYRLAEKFHGFFHQCRVEGSPKQNSRLLLCFATAQVLHQGLLLLGLKPLERM